MSGKGYGCRDSVQAPLTLITAFLRLARPSTLGSSVVSRAHVFSAAQIMRADSRRNAQLLLVKLGSFCYAPWRSSTSRRGCFAVLIWRPEHSRSGGELLPVD